jgi:hypothetical protein
MAQYILLSQIHHTGLIFPFIDENNAPSRIIADDHLYLTYRHKRVVEFVKTRKGQDGYYDNMVGNTEMVLNDQVEASFIHPQKVFS